MKPNTLPYQQGSSAGYTNRAQEMRRDNDIVKIPKITLYDIDYAIWYHLTSVFKPRITQNSSQIPVPVIIADGEKWSQIRAQGFMRDVNKKILAPVIVLKRNDVSADERLPIVSTNLFQPAYRILPYKTSNMQYDRFLGQFATKNSFEYYLVDVPDYIRLTYDLVIFTDLIEQMNVLVQGIIPLSNHVWGDYYKFRTVVQSATHDNINVPGSDRVVKSTLTLQVDGYLRNEYEYQQSKIQKAYSLKRVDFLNENTDDVLLGETTDLMLPNTQSPRISDQNDNGLRKKIRI